MGLTSAIFMASAVATSSNFVLKPQLAAFKFALKFHVNLNFDGKASVIIQKICNLSFNRSLRPSLRRERCRRLCCSQVQIQDDTDEEACELVNGVELSIGEGSDSVAAYLLTAVKNNNGTGILLLSDIFGFEDSSTRDFAYRIACNGY
ncbi:hypothetical protein Tco_0920924, partial [Tanacetum coccineum]